MPRCSQDGHHRRAPSDWGDPEAPLSQREFFGTLQACLERLPKRTAQAFALREIQGQSTEEIGGTLGVSGANCWVMLHRARLSLREALEAERFGGGAKASAPEGGARGGGRRVVGLS